MAGAPPLVLHPVEPKHPLPLSTNNALDVVLAKRVALINNIGYTCLPAEACVAIAEIQRLSTAYAQDMRLVMTGSKLVDTGRCIAAMDHIQQAKNIAVDALKLPYVPDHILVNRDE